MEDTIFIPKMFEDTELIVLGVLKTRLSAMVSEAANERRSAFVNQDYRTAYEKDVELKVYQKMLDMFQGVGEPIKCSTIKSETFFNRTHFSKEILTEISVEEIRDILAKRIISSTEFRKSVRDNTKIRICDTDPNTHEKIFEASYKINRVVEEDGHVCE